MACAADAFPHPGPLPQAGEGEGGGRRVVNEDAISISLSRTRERAGVRVQNARALRANATDAELLLWRHLRNRQLAGHKFRRQHPVGPYILDFVCLEKGVVVELDGGQHATPAGQERDARRTAWLQAQGLQVLRFWNHEVLQMTNEVLEHVLQALAPAPSLREEGGRTNKDTPS